GAFADGWQLGSVAAVWPDADGELSVITGLAALLTHNLIQHHPQLDDPLEPRYVMLETIREFALEELSISGDASRVQRAHARRCGRLGEDAEFHIISAARNIWLHRLENELDNVRSALAWSISDEGDTELGLRLVGSLWGTWYLLGHLQEGRRWAQRLLAQTEPACRSEGRARALFSVGALALLQDDAQRAQTWLAESVQLMRATEDPRLPYALTHLGWSLTDLGQPAEARALYRESTAVAVARGDRWSIAYTLAVDATALARLG